MGNSESQYSIQGPKGSGFVFPGKARPSSLKQRSARDGALSPHSWWKSAPIGSGYKARCVGRGCLSPPKSRQPYSPRHYDYVSRGAARGGPREHRCQQQQQQLSGCGARRRRISEDYDDDNPYGAELDGRALNGHGGGGGELEDLEQQSSPRVVIKKDGSLRVEFTNNSGNPLLLDEASGPVQLLKFSPHLDTASTPSLPDSSGHCSGPPPASTSSTARTSKGSSLSSDGSWYDSPWGNGGELCEQDHHHPQSPHPQGPPADTPVHSPVRQLDGFAERSSPPECVGGLYKDPRMVSTFATSRDLGLQLQQEPPPGPGRHRDSFASVLDVPLQEECSDVPQYSSYTLPCRRPKAHTISEHLDRYAEPGRHGEPTAPEFGFQKKGSIKNRMRRLSDWTGSLSRKKRKSQVSPDG